ncbi:hypothetical protein K435DRAFT_795885 [Dendrothele bispora CBS 962.96]|uniref:Uncharacterized protein n=1 Tax=Dendrothele bispora (strain CBS 962.96) TaxID=1314807 RepID=A0A4S8M7D5_DENBC|nr:hypothetical protein K435DRAFT_795885 [Dendrothele bispora CBS 962.96]
MSRTNFGIGSSAKASSSLPSLVTRLILDINPFFPENIAARHNESSTLDNPRLRLSEKSISFEDLPSNVRDAFNGTFMQAVIELTGCIRAWNTPNVDQLHEIWTKAMPDNMHHHFSDLNTRRLIENLASNQVLESVLIRALLQRKEYVAKQINGDYWVRPYYFANISEQSSGQVQRTGTFQSYIVSKTLSEHFKAIQSIPHDRRTKDRPIGAIVLTILAIERAFRAYSTGRKVLPPGPESEFSQRNWDDRVVMRNGRPYKLKTTSQIHSLFGRNVNNVERVSPELWDKIIAAAETYLPSLRFTNEENRDDESSDDMMMTRVFTIVLRNVLHRVSHFLLQQFPHIP